LSGAKAASIWSELLGKAIRYPGEDMDDCDAVAALSARAGPHQLILPSIA